MSAALGVGVRVWVGWCADERASPSVRALRLSTGTIVGGPIAPASKILTDEGTTQTLPLRLWQVVFDADPDVCIVAEYLLTPLDDDGECTDDEVRNAVGAPS